jgi:hypothetical protein
MRGFERRCWESWELSGRRLGWVEGWEGWISLIFVNNFSLISLLTLGFDLLSQESVLLIHQSIIALYLWLFLLRFLSSAFISAILKLILRKDTILMERVWIEIILVCLSFDYHLIDFRVSWRRLLQITETPFIQRGDILLMRLLLLSRRFGNRSLFLVAIHGIFRLLWVPNTYFSLLWLL